MHSSIHTLGQRSLNILSVLGPGGIPGQSDRAPAYGIEGGASALHKQEVVSATREVQIVCWGICLQQGVALPAGGVRRTSRTSWLALQGRVGFQHVEMSRGSSKQSKCVSKSGSEKMRAQEGQR